MHSRKLSTTSLTPQFLCQWQRQPDAVGARFVAAYHSRCALPRWVRRRLPRQWKQSLAGVALMLTLGVTPTWAATINVTTTTPDINADGQCSLIEAIDNANDTTTGTVHNDCEGGDPTGADTITLPANSTHTLTAVNTDFVGPTGLPRITSVITIAGHGSTITRDPDTDPFRILALDGSGNLTVQDTTVRGGSVPGAGGGIAGFFGADVTLDGCTVTGNAAASGGGIYVEPSGSQIEIRNSTISNNTASDSGGGVMIVGFGGIVRLLNNTISGNSAVNNGGGVNSETIFSGTEILMEYSTVSGNTASNGGGVASRLSSTMGLRGTLIAGNTATSAGNEVYRSGAGTFTVDGVNLFGHNGITTAEALVGFTPGTSDILATLGETNATALSAILSPLMDNGGPPQTHALPDGSPAIDRIAADFPATDQRGVTRPQGSAADIGAFELEIDTAVTTDDLLAFFDQAVADGTLQGVGSGGLALLRLKAMHLTLVVADELVERNRTNLACADLQVAYRLTDGQGQPTDLVTGPAAPELALLITATRETLGCE
ncbi:MAG: choice-of-anchor Q domain-containing protein [Candidatus Binatia bacterium]